MKWKEEIDDKETSSVGDKVGNVTQRKGICEKTEGHSEENDSHFLPTYNKVNQNPR